MGRTVYLAVITGRNDVTNAGVTVRASSLPYHGGTSIYRARISGLDIQYEMEAGLLTARENTAAIDIINQDALVDSWVDYRFVSVTIRKGDVDKAFSATNFPKIFEGPIHDVQASINSINIIVVDKLQNLNKVIDQSDLKSSVFSGAGNPGSVCRGFLTYNDSTGYSTGIAASSLDKSSFDAIDRTYPYPLLIENEAFDASLNYLDVVDAALNGLPVSLQVSSRGQFYLARFREPANVGFPQFDAEEVISIDRIWPIGELRSSYFEIGSDYRQTDRPTRIHRDVKTLYPQNWRSASIGPIYVSQNNANNRARSVDTMSDAFMKVFDRPYDRIRISTRKDVSNIRLGSYASFRLPRLGHRNGVAVLVTAINERLDGFHEIEGWAPSKLGAGNGRIIQGAERVDPDDDQALTEPGTPGTPVPSQVTASSIQWEWAESTGTVSRYDIRWRALNGSWSAWTNNGLSTSYFLDSLTANTTYQFQVRAVNSVGDSSIAFGDQRTNNVAPTPQIVLSKSRLNIDEGGTGTFTVRLSAAGTKTVSLASNNADVTLSPTSADFTPSDFSTAITITVSAAEDVDTVTDTATITASGPGMTSKTIAVTVKENDEAITRPGAPGTPVASGVTTSSMTWTWAESTGVVSRYEFRWRVQNGTWEEWASNGTSTSYFLDSLNANTTYQFQVRAVNSVDESLVSSANQRTNNVAPTPQIVLSRTTLKITEGSSGNFTARLSASGTKTVSFASNNADVSLSPTSYAFTPSNFSTARTITVTAGQDDDKTDDTATVTASGPGMNNKTIAVTVTDDDKTVTPPVRPDPPDPNAVYVRVKFTGKREDRPNSVDKQINFRFEYRDKDDNQKRITEGSISYRFNVAIEGPSISTPRQQPAVFLFDGSRFREQGGAGIYTETGTTDGGNTYESDRWRIRINDPTRRASQGYSGPAGHQITVTILPGDGYEIGTVSSFSASTTGAFVND